jgi:hypothetical protein
MKYDVILSQANNFHQLMLKVTANHNIGYYGSTTLFTDWNISKTKEFGYHFGFDQDQSIHRINGQGYLYKVKLSYSNPLQTSDAIYWDLRAILKILGKSDQYSVLKSRASEIAKKKGSSLRMEENMIAAEVLEEAGYDSIMYDNQGEGGGDAIIIWNPSQIQVIDVKRLGDNE